LIGDGESIEVGGCDDVAIVVAIPIRRTPHTKANKKKKDDEDAFHN
jgi:hypothetical protein